MRWPLNRRLTNLSLFVACLALLGYAYYAQFVLHLEPCPLCIFQRVALIALAFVFLLAFAFSKEGRSRLVFAGLIDLVALIGAAIAGWHVWIQNLPPEQVPECGPGLEYMLDVFPLTDTIRMVFTGSGECANVDWSLLGLSMPAWVLIAFIGLGAAGVVNQLRRN